MSTYGIKYCCEFYDLNKLHWKIDFLFPDYEESDGITDLLASGDDCLDFDFDNESDKIMDPIRATGITLTVIGFPEFGLFDLYSVEDRHVKVNVYAIDDEADSSGDLQLFWSGWVKGKDFQEQYEPDNHTASITCTDGLEDLKDINYDNNGTIYSGWRRESQIILDILAKIGYSEFIESVDIYEQGMLDSTDDSPVEQAYLDTYNFVDKDCWEVLQQIVSSYDAIIRQREGIFSISRPSNHIKTTIYARHFTGTTTKTSITYNAYSPNGAGQVPGGVKMTVSPLRKVTITQDYGNRESWLNNYQFKNDTFTLISLIDGYSVENWTRVGAVCLSPISSLIKSETEGIILLGKNAYPAKTKYIMQEFAENAIVSTTDFFTIEFEFLYYNANAIPLSNFIFYVKLCNTAGTHWIHNNNTDQLDDLDDIQDATSLQYITIKLNVVDVGISDWMTFKRQFTGLPIAGPFQIYIYGTNSSGYEAQVHIAVRNVKIGTHSMESSLKAEKQFRPVTKPKNSIFGSILVTVSEAYYTFPVIPKTITSHEYTAVNNVNGVEYKFDMMIGDADPDILNVDNIVSQFAGAIALNSGTPTIRVDDITLTGVTGAAFITVDGVTELAEFDIDLDTTAQNFIDDLGSHYSPLVVTRTNHTLHFTGPSAGYDFTGETRIDQDVLNLDGTVTQGSAYTYTFQPSSAWSIQGESSYQPLLQLIADEIAEFYNRSKMLVQMPLQEIKKHISVDMMGGFWSTHLLYGGRLALFTASRGRFTARMRKWMIDLFETGVGEEVESSGELITADDTTHTVDDTTITVDNG